MRQSLVRLTILNKKLNISLCAYYNFNGKGLWGYLAADVFIFYGWHGIKNYTSANAPCK